MLTGDKLETAESIARSCNLINKDMNVVYLKEEILENVENNLK